MSPKRNYDYDTDYEDRPDQVRARTSRNKAHKLMGCPDGDVNHKDGNPLNNKLSNLEVESPSKNRARKPRSVLARREPSSKSVSTYISLKKTGKKARGSS